jgi:hypothetical protein
VAPFTSCARQAAVFHARRRRQYHQPGLVGGFQPDKTVRMLITGFLDGAAQSQRPLIVILAPPVMRAGLGGNEQRQY